MHLELARGGLWRSELDRVLVLAELVVERHLPHRRLQGRRMGKIGSRQDPAGIHDIDEKDRTFAPHRCVIFERQYQLVGAGFQVLAGVALESTQLARTRVGVQSISGISQAHAAVTSKLGRQPPHETRPIVLLRGGPTDLRNRRGARECHVGDPVFRAYVLRPHVSLQSEDMLALIRSDSRRHRVEVVNVV